MAKIKVYEDNRRLGSTSSAFNCIVTEELMRGYTLSFSITNNNAIFAVLSENCIIEHAGQKFDLSGIDTQTGTTNITQVLAEHISYRLSNYAIPAGYAFVGTLREIAEDILNTAEDITTGKHASEEFTIRDCPDGESHSFRMLNTDDATARDALITLSKLNVEIVFDNFNVDIVERRGAGGHTTFTYTENLVNTHRVYQKGNGWTYEISAADIGDIELGSDVTVIDGASSKNVETRVIAVTKCEDDSRQDRIMVGQFILDSATQSAETNRIANEANKKASKSLQEGEKYSNVYINHQDGVVAENRLGTLRVVMNGDDCFAVQKLVSGQWITVTSTEDWGILANRLTNMDAKNTFYVNVGKISTNEHGLQFVKKYSNGSEEIFLEIGSSEDIANPIIKSRHAIHIQSDEGVLINNELIGSGFSGNIAVATAVRKYQIGSEYRYEYLWRNIIVSKGLITGIGAEMREPIE